MSNGAHRASGLVKVHKGARLSFLRRKVSGEVWLPAVVSYNGTCRPCRRYAGITTLPRPWHESRRLSRYSIRNATAGSMDRKCTVRSTAGIDPGLVD